MYHCNYQRTIIETEQNCLWVIIVAPEADKNLEENRLDQKLDSKSQKTITVKLC